MAWQGSTRSARLPADWPKRRAYVLKRDGGRCFLCGGAGADTVDHVVRGDNHDVSNLAAVHDRTAPHCHRAKTAREAQEARALARAARPARWREAERHPGLK